MIIINDEEKLRIKCDLVLESEVGDLISTLENELKYANKLGKQGIGLAAPQCGIAKNIAIIRTEKINLNLINCKIEKYYNPAIFRHEGCLSFPGRVEDTARYQEIYVTNNLVYPYNFIATGLLSVIVQHEVDHLNSKLFIDYIVPKQVPIINKIKVGPNDSCPCGKIDLITNKIKKFKKCCGRN